MSGTQEQQQQQLAGQEDPNQPLVPQPGDPQIGGDAGAQQNVQNVGAGLAGNQGNQKPAGQAPNQN